MTQSAKLPSETPEGASTSPLKNPGYIEAVEEFNLLWDTNSVRHSRARMDELAGIIEAYERPLPKPTRSTGI